MRVFDCLGSLKMIPAKKKLRIRDRHIFKIFQLPLNVVEILKDLLLVNHVKNEFGYPSLREATFGRDLMRW